MLKKKPKPAADPHKTNLEKVRQRHAEMASDSGWWKAKKPGKYILRILPPWGAAADGMFYFTGGLHYGFSIGGQNRALPCPEMGGRGACPVCRVVEQLRSRSDEDEDAKSLLRKIGLKKKFWVNLIDRADSGGNVFMYGGNKKFVDELMGAMEDDDIGDITDPDEGHDVVCVREGTGMNDTRYSWRVRPKPTPIGLPDWKEKLHQLDDEVLEYVSTDEMKTHLKRNFGDTLEEMGISLGGSKKKEEPLKKKKKVEEDDDDEDDDDDDD